MKWTVLVGVCVLMLAGLVQDTASRYAQQPGSLYYRPAGDCFCTNCKCISKTFCPDEYIKPYLNCPGNYIFLCCNMSYVDEALNNFQSYP